MKKGTATVIASHWDGTHAYEVTQRPVYEKSTCK